MVNKTYLPHTYENQAILRDYGTEIAGQFGKQVHLMKGPGLWARICSYFPCSQISGYKAGELLGATYGAQWSNTTIDFVFRRFFVPAAGTSFWSQLKHIIFGATELTIAQRIAMTMTQMTLTPKLAPYISLISGTIMAIALPKLIEMISALYQKVMFNPRKLQQLPQLSLHRFFKLDPQTNRMKDVFGRVMSSEDMKEVLAGAAKYDLICKLIDLSHRVDQIKADSDVLQKKAQEMLEILVESYTIRCSDGRLMFPDGHLCTLEDQEIIQQGIRDLSRVNPCHKKKKIRQFIRLLANHSIVPAETFSTNEKIGLEGSPKRIPALFPKEEQWKNAIIRTQDGRYVINQDVGDKKKGTIIEKQEMIKILEELRILQRQKTAI